MSRAERRRFEKTFQTINKSEECTLCHRPFEHNSRTYGGFTRNNATALVGTCCQGKLESVYVQGVFVTRNINTVPLPIEGAAAKPMKHTDVSQAVDLLQAHLNNMDDLAEQVSKRAGVTGKNTEVFTLESAWKEDDARWFRKHRKRTHRLRPAFPGEIASMEQRIGPMVMPPGHEVQVLVRQVEEGTRIRAPFGRNLNMPIPDEEPVIEALFDTVSDPDATGVISVDEIVARARKNSPISGARH